MIYTIGIQGVKPHFSSNYFIAQQVKDNLISRFEGTCLIKEFDKSSRFIWNPGGSSYGDTIFEFGLAGITLGCYASHWVSFKNRISELDSAQHGGKFFKLHGVINLCISLAQKNQLDYIINIKTKELNELARQERKLLSTY